MATTTQTIRYASPRREDRGGLRLFLGLAPAAHPRGQAASLPCNEFARSPGRRRSRRGGILVGRGFVNSRCQRIRTSARSHSYLAARSASPGPPSTQGWLLFCPQRFAISPGGGPESKAGLYSPPDRGQPFLFGKGLPDGQGSHPNPGNPQELLGVLRHGEGRQILHLRWRQQHQMLPLAVSLRVAPQNRAQAPWRQVLTAGSHARCPGAHRGSTFLNIVFSPMACLLPLFERPGAVGGMAGSQP